MCHAFGVTCSLRPPASGPMRLQTSSAANGHGPSVNGSTGGGAAIRSCATGSAKKGNKNKGNRSGGVAQLSTDDFRMPSPSRLLQRPAAGSTGDRSASPRGSWASPLLRLLSYANTSIKVSVDPDRNSAKQHAAGMPPLPHTHTRRHIHTHT